MTSFRDAQALMQAGRHAEARAILQDIIELDPGDFEANYLLGIVLVATRDMAGAVAALQQAAEINSNHAELQRNLGALLAGQGRIAGALPHFQRAVELDPNDGVSLLYLGQALQQLDRHDEAADILARAHSLQPSPDLRLRLAMSEDRRGNDEAAVHHYAALLQADPGHVDAAVRLSDLLLRRGAFPDAIRMLTQVAARRPRDAELQRRLGMAHRHAGQKPDAATHYRQAVALEPDHVEAQMELGELLLELRDPAGAVAAFRRALAAKPDHAQAVHRLYYGLMSFCAWDEAQRLVPAIDAMTDAALAKGEPPIEPPFLNLIHCDRAERNAAIARAWGKALTVSPAARDAARIVRSPDSSSRLRIGYLSYDFRDHAVAQLTCRLFELHDRNRFEIHAYSYGPDDRSVLRRRIAGAVEQFHDIAGEDYAGSARRIAADGIDILVELAGHTMNSRLKILAYRPAPVQVSWLGFPGSTGCPFVDYLISDRIVTPIEHAPHYSEQLCCLPESFQPNDNLQAISPATVTRRDYNLPEDVPVFCSFNRPYKIEPVMFDVWMQILAALPGSVLWLHEGPDALDDNLRREAQARGVDGSRIVFANRPDKPLHMKRLGLADLALDTRLYNGHTTSSDALWAGVPVVTLLGNHFPSRVSASALTAIGLPDLIAGSLDQYREIAIRYGGDRAANAALKQRLAANRTTWPLYDSARFARRMEQAFEAMWQRHLAHAAPAPIDLPG